MPTDDLAGVLLGTLAAALEWPSIGVEHISLRSASPVVGTAGSTEAPTRPG